jgi:hypothetical protein
MSPKTHAVIYGKKTGIVNSFKVTALLACRSDQTSSCTALSIPVQVNISMSLRNVNGIPYMS